MVTVLIGSSGHYDAPFPPGECVRRLNDARDSGTFVGRADGAGFQLVIYGRTAVRIRGVFTPTATGSRVDYRIDLIPEVLWAVVLALAVSIPILVGMAWVGYVSWQTLAFAFVIATAVLALNGWVSEWQARRLRDLLGSALNALMP
jgi:hypothetical protein